MKDEQGVALLLRTWRSRYGTSEYELSEPSLRGSAMFLRSDLFERLRVILDVRLVWREHTVGVNMSQLSVPPPQSPLLPTDRSDFDLPAV